MKAIIEMPKGDTRRRHLAHDKSRLVDLGLIQDVIPANDGVMPVHYGYLPGTINSDEGDEIDVLVYSPSAMAVGQEVGVRPIALLRREDKDNKVVAVPEDEREVFSWTDIPESERVIMERFFGYHHKIIAVEGAEAARTYVRENQAQTNS